jgi:hypothetical protein
MRKSERMRRLFVGWNIKDPPLTRWVYGKASETAPRASFAALLC